VKLLSGEGTLSCHFSGCYIQQRVECLTNEYIILREAVPWEWSALLFVVLVLLKTLTECQTFCYSHASLSSP